MQIKIKTINIEMTDAISSYVEEKLQSLEKFAIPHDEENPLLYVEIGKTTNHHQSGDIFRAEVSMTVRGKQFRAVSKKDDLYAAIDDMRAELMRELTSYKTKERSLARRGAGMIKNLLRFGREK
ncbi:MAG: ribosomal subunit interface protein [Candidatus Yonathbacteria bacterium RIFOXYC2_FULL_47_9]|nr:MAG: ribosomal subunit interface protein [Candidatus Yonathbacteria bacterium RIFOXYC2_FULL_47_9]HAT68541.1 ribosome-associated translation inhibitor RaiA [Candidatus Yonathbacteria bacterium]